MKSFQKYQGVITYHQWFCYILKKMANKRQKFSSVQRNHFIIISEYAQNFISNPD